MIIDDLYREALLDPIDSGANELFAVSGYASASFANRHLRETVASGAKINLIVGMRGNRCDHPGFLKLFRVYPGRFNGFYIDAGPDIHCKAYGWFQDNHPVRGYTGSANYSSKAFVGRSQINQLIVDNPIEIRQLYNNLLPDSIPMQRYAGGAVTRPAALPARHTIAGSVPPGTIFWEVPDRRVRISFLARDGTMPERSGLNWGQRPEEGRDPNQAYLSLRKESRDEGFLPPLAQTFSLITDDNDSIDCVVAQDNRKAIHSTNNNSELGVYARRRLGVPLGDLVTVEHLEAYGRTDFTIEKIDEETFLLDLSIE